MSFRRAGARRYVTDEFGRRRNVPHLRCGICDSEFGEDDDAVYVDDERCHRDCAEGHDSPTQSQGLNEDHDYNYD